MKNVVRLSKEGCSFEVPTWIWESEDKDNLILDEIDKQGYSFIPDSDVVYLETY